MEKIMRSFKNYVLNLREDSTAALKYAVKSHAGQFRSDGSPYVKHPERVAEFVKKFKKSHNLDALISAAYLHDTIEDTDTTHEDLEKMFGGLIASLVKELTSDSEKVKSMGKDEYLADKMSKMSSWGLVIKLADRLDNVRDITTAKTPEWRRKYRSETEKILSRLERDRELTSTHKRIIQTIRDKLSEVE
jgi:GTP diphosphokinase / guanosine-3',5'-bis(diphosphate) 3'-diphosphatase